MERFLTKMTKEKLKFGVLRPKKWVKCEDCGCIKHIDRKCCCEIVEQEQGIEEDTNSSSLEGLEQENEDSWGVN